MNMYLRMFDELNRVPGNKLTIGIILCPEKEETLVRYSGVDENKHLVASRFTRSWTVAVDLCSLKAISLCVNVPSLCRMRNLSISV